MRFSPCLHVLLLSAILCLAGCGSAPPAAATQWYTTKADLKDGSNIGRQLKQDDVARVWLFVTATFPPQELWQARSRPDKHGSHTWALEDFKLLTPNGGKIPVTVEQTRDGNYSQNPHYGDLSPDMQVATLVFTVEEAVANAGNLQLQLRNLPPLPLTPDNKVSAPVP